jgi:hypothetical protein
MYDLLKGLRVVEGAAFIAGPSCGLHFAQLGAEVIRFDAIGGGPDYRRWPLAPDGSSLYWEGLNKGKKSIALDLSRPEGRELAVALATAPGEDGGLFLTNYPVKGFLSHAALKARREDIISLRVMGWADGAPAVDYTVNAATGIPMMTGPADDARPVNHVLPAWDLLGGAYAAFAAVSALLRRRATGEGAEIRVPLSDLAASALSHLGQVAEVLTGGDRPRMGNDLFGAFGRDFLTMDGARLIVVAITPRQWSGLVKCWIWPRRWQRWKPNWAWILPKRGRPLHPSRAPVPAVRGRLRRARQCGAETRLRCGRRHLGAISKPASGRDHRRAAVHRQPAVPAADAPQRAHLSHLRPRRHFRQRGARCPPPRALANIPTRCWQACWGWAAGRSGNCTTKGWWHEHHRNPDRPLAHMDRQNRDPRGSAGHRGPAPLRRRAGRKP